MRWTLRLSTFLAGLAALGSPGLASAADTVVAPDPAAQAVTALDGTVVAECDLDSHGRAA